MQKETKRKPIVKKLVCFLIMVALFAQFLNFLPLRPFSEAQALTFETSTSIRQTSIFKHNYGKIQLSYAEKMQEIPDFKERTISKIKFVYGFNGEIYVVIECLPTGYLIYSFEYDILLEFAADSPSPYLDKDDNLLYVGPTYYYQAEEAKQISEFVISDLLSGEETRLLPEDFKAFQAVSANVSNSLEAKALEKAIAEAAMPSLVQPMGIYTKSGAWEEWWVNNSGSLSNLTQFGSNESGSCGWLAAAINIFYLQVNCNSNFIPSNWLFYTGGVVSGMTDDLHQLLWNAALAGGLWTATIGPEVAIVLEAYILARGLQFQYAAMASVFGLWNHNTLRTNFLLNRPVCMFGSLTSPAGGGRINHAIVAYAAKCQTYALILKRNYVVAHFGWSGYRAVSVLDDIFTNVFSSIVYIL